MMPVMTSAGKKNDWTLDTNVLIVANGVKSRSRDKRVARELFNCIGNNGWLCWNSKIVQEYISRGAIHLVESGPPPTLPVQENQQNMTWVDLWLTRPGVLSRIYQPKLKKLSGSEKEKLARKQFRDSDDHRFMALARSSVSKRLVTQEKHYNKKTIPVIKRVLGVVCLDYVSARNECKGGR